MSAPLIAAPAIAEMQKRAFDPVHVGIEGFGDHAASQRVQIVSSYLETETNPDPTAYVDAVAAATSLACSATENWLSHNPEQAADIEISTARPDLAVRVVSAL